MYALARLGLRRFCVAGVGLAVLAKGLMGSCANRR